MTPKGSFLFGIPLEPPTKGYPLKSTPVLPVSPIPSRLEIPISKPTRLAALSDLAGAKAEGAVTHTREGSRGREGKSSPTRSSIEKPI